MNTEFLLCNENAISYLRNKIHQLKDNLKLPCLDIVKDDRFRLWPASIEKHHTYVGGLCLHTAEVLEIALSMVQATSIVVNREVLIVSAIFHDYAKIFDYEVDNKERYNKIHDHFSKAGVSIAEVAGMIWKKSPHRYLVRHPVRSYAEWMRLSTIYNVDEETKLSISHAILAHHGRLEWNSPVEPQTVEAQILHQSDMISSRYGKSRGAYGIET